MPLDGEEASVSLSAWLLTQNQLVARFCEFSLQKGYELGARASGISSFKGMPYTYLS